jgi:hypothetical protein
VSSYFSKCTDITFINEVEELAQIIKSSGAIQPAVYDGDDFKGSSIILLDFDNNKKKPYSFNDVMTLAKDNNILPNIVYKTLNCSRRKIDKFRLVYVLDAVIDEEEVYHQLLYVFHKIFIKYMDKSSKGSKRFFFTGSRIVKDEICYINNNKTELSNLAYNFSLILNEYTKTKSYPSRVINSIPVLKNNNLSVLKGIDKDDLLESCRLYREADSGKIRLTHDDKTLLLSSFNYITNSTTHLLETLQSTGNTKNISKWEKTAEYFVNKNYYPIRCKGKCRFYDKCKAKSVYNKISNTGNSTDDVIKLNENGIHPELIMDMFIDDMRRIIQSSNTDNDIHIFTLPSGIGKTDSLIKYFANYGVVAFKNHKLKDEKAIEYQQHHEKYPSTTMNLKDIVVDEDDIDLISMSYDKGDGKTVRDTIKKYSGGDDYLRRSCIPLVSSVFTTHDKTMRAKFDDSVNNIFFDEDPIDSIFSTTSYFNLKDDVDTLNKHKDVIGLTDKNIEFLYGLEKRLKTLDIPEKIKFSNVEKRHIGNITDKLKSKSKDVKISLNNNIAALLNATSFYKNSYSEVKELPNKRIFILSATPDVDFYRDMFKDRKIISKKYDNVLKKGSIRHISIPTSITALKDERNINAIKEHSNGSKVITFKNLKGVFDSDDMPHGGDVMGYNYLSGKNICVALTYQKPGIVYAHKVVSKGYTLSNNWKSISYKKVIYKGNKFMFPTFNDINMKNEQLFTIDTEIYQAVERARLIRNDATVTIFSKFVPSMIK